MMGGLLQRGRLAPWAPTWGGWLALGLAVLLLGGCGSIGGTRGGDPTPEDVEAGRIPDAVPRVEPKSRSGNAETYVVRGKRFRTKADSKGHVERGVASWYGKKFHGRKTSSGEPYNMYAMSAAHRTLPLPSYVRVTNVESGQSAVVRVNDRGPFHGRRVIDLSYAAAKKIGVVSKGTALVEVRALDPTRGREPEPDRSERTLAASAAETPIPPRAKTRASAAPKTVATASTETKIRAVAAATQALAAPPVRAAAGARAGDLYLQVGAFGDANNAERLRQRLAGSLAEPVRVQDGGAAPAPYKVRIGPLTSEGEARQVKAKLVRLGVPEPRMVWN